MAKLKVPHNDYLQYRGAGHQEYWFMCPGCKYDHTFIVQYGANEKKTEPKWSFNGDLDKPTFSPSLLYREYDGDEVSHICHSYVRDGSIQFLNDCTHDLKGQTVALAEV